MVGRPAKPAPANTVHRLRELRIRAGITIEELAVRMSLSPKQVRRLELGQAQLKPQQVAAAARALSIETRDIYGELQISSEEQELIRIFREMRAEKRPDYLAIGRTLNDNQAAPFRAP